MNDPTSDGNENVIDIFVLCKSETEAPLNTEHLEQKGYRVTLFSDTDHLLETLRYGKPNLLICDSHTLGEDAYAICRQIKADNELWMIPVLIMTRASSLGDLLYVLDCNADNFIAYPYDPSYLHSLIGGIIATPVERPTPEQIKTQFKIQHDENLFVVTADRRKLLEFLLSSFEIAVNKSEELASAVSENNDLRMAAARADEVAGEQARVIEVLNGTIQQREQAISALNDEIKDKATRIADLSREKESFILEREADKNLIGATEEQVRTLIQDREETDRTHSTAIGELSQRLASTSEELATVTSELKTTREALERETTLRTETEATLAEMVPAKEQMEKSLRAATLECEQARSSCSAEQNRALTAEQENKSLILAKAQSEQDLTKIIDELKETARQQSGDLITLREEQVADRNQVSSLESRLATLATEKEEAETGLMKAADDLRRELEGQKATCDTSSAALDEKTRRIAEMEQACAEQQSETAKAQAQVQSLENELGSLRKALEEKTQSSLDLEHICNELKDAGGQALAQIRALDSEIEELRAALEGERQQHAATRQSLQGVLQERDTALSSLQGAHEEVKSDLDSHRDDLALAKQELLTVSEERMAMENRLAESVAQIQSLEDKLAAASGDQAESDKQVRSLSDELEQVKAALETERRRHQTNEENIRSAVMADEKAEETARRIAEEQERVKKMLASEQEERRNAEERLRSLEDASEHRVRELSDNLAEAQTRITEFEEQVGRITREKADAEALAASFEAEIEEARAALADEWEDHMTDNERFAAARQSSGPGLAADIHAVTPRTPDLPAEVPASPGAVVAVPDPAEDPIIPPVTRVEDLFEDEVDTRDPEELPSVSIISDPVPEDPDGEVASGEVGAAGDDEEYAGENNEETVDEPDEDAEGEDTDDKDDEPAPSFNATPPVSAAAFDRSQWFDLLKWAHHSGALSQEQRLQIVRMGRLIQKGRRLTHKQDEQVREMIGLVQSLGYRFT